VVALTFLLIALIAVVAAQLVPTPWSARVTTALVLTGCFAVRAIADTQRHPWLNWVTPFGLRATAAPFTSNRILPLVVTLCVAVLLAVLAVALERSRELGSSIVRVPRPGFTTAGSHRPWVLPGVWGGPRPSGGSPESPREGPCSPRWGPAW